MKCERMAKRSTFGSIMKKRLSDITNFQPQPKILSHEENTSLVSPASEYLVNQLIKEKMTLMRLIDERNKIIELSGNELQNLRINLQKLQLQNWNLAQSNSQILAELNLGREKVNALQHELLCKDALLKAKNIEKEGKTDENCENTGSQEGQRVAEECMLKAKDDIPCKPNRRRGERSKSLGPNPTRRQVAEKENVENKRRCVRRQSARFKSQEQRVPTENMFEIEDTKFPLDDPMHEDSSTQETCSLRNEAKLPQRSSLGRPSRKAAEKVQCYKEIPLNVKMRRKE